MKAVFLYDNGKKYHADVLEFIEKSKTSVRYIQSTGKWKEGVRSVSEEVEIDPVRSGLVSITVQYTSLGDNAPTAQTIYTFKPFPKKKHSSPKTKMENGIEQCSDNPPVQIQEGVWYTTRDMNLWYVLDNSGFVFYRTATSGIRKSAHDKVDFLDKINSGELINTKLKVNFPKWTIDLVSDT